MGKEFNEVCRKVGSEGIVLLKNDKQVLSLGKGTCVSVFGRIQSNYIKSGTGCVTNFAIRPTSSFKTMYICGF